MNIEQPILRHTMNTETAYELFNRIHGKLRPKLDNFYPNIFSPKTQLTNKIIQIYGASNTGKSLLICELLLHAILPTKISSTFKQSNAILINTDHQISIIQIIKIAEEKLRNLKISQDEHQEIIKSSLKRLTILNCYAFNQFEMTILNLEHLLSELLDVALIAIDSLSAYYWTERYEKSLDVRENKLCSINKHCINLLKILKSVIGDSHVTVFSKCETEATLKAFVDFSIKLSYDKNECNRYIMSLECHNDTKGVQLVRRYTIESGLKFNH